MPVFLTLLVDQYTNITDPQSLRDGENGVRIFSMVFVFLLK